MGDIKKFMLDAIATKRRRYNRLYKSYYSLFGEYSAKAKATKLYVDLYDRAFNYVLSVDNGQDKDGIWSLDLFCFELDKDLSNSKYDEGTKKVMREVLNELYKIM